MVKPAKAIDFKTRLLADITPKGFDAARFSGDIHMIQKPTPGRPTARVMTRDGGWLEIAIDSKKNH